MEVKHQREDRLAGHVVKLDLAPTQVLSGGERIDLSGFRGSLSDRRVIIRVLDVNFPSWFAEPKFSAQQTSLFHWTIMLNLLFICILLKLCPVELT